MIKMIFNVAASESGALSILHEYYEKAKLDIKNHYIFVISDPQLVDTENIQFLRYPWVKKSPFHRLYFDYLIASKLVKINKPDEVISMQNIKIPKLKQLQTVYLHTFLPFSKYKIKIYSEPYLWYQKYIIGFLIKKNISKVNRIIVQALWFKDFLVENYKLKAEQIIVEKPKLKYINVKSKIKNKEKYNGNVIKFIYPANAFSYKNHDFLLKLAVLFRDNYIKAEINFTLAENDNRNTKRMAKIVKKEKLPVNFIGKLERAVLIDEYLSSTLIFPSLIETVGLPLLEAKHFEANIIAIDLEYSRETIGNYEKLLLFEFDKVKDLYKKLLDFFEL